MRLLIQYLAKHKKLLFGALGLATINQFFSLLDPQIFRLIIDQYATRIDSYTPEAFARGVALLLLGSIFVALVSRIAKNFQDYFVNVVSQRVGASLYADSVEHAFSLPYAVFEDQRSGEFLQKIQKAKLDSQQLIASAVNIVFLSIIGMVFVITYALYVNWLIGLTYVLMIPLLGIITFLVSKKIEVAQRNIVREAADLAGATTETLRNVELVKSLGLEAQETKRLNSVNDKILGLELKKVTLIRMLSFLQGSMVNITRSLLLLLMLWLIFSRAITLGEFFSLLFYSFAIFSPLYELGNVASQYQEAKASLKNLHEVLVTPPAPRAKQPKNVGTIKTVVFDSVGFSYNGDTVSAVNNITLTIHPGSTVAFVGPSGSGKSTLVKLLVGLYQPTAGVFSINGIDSRDIDYDDVRHRIGYVSQDTQLFAGTIRENLLFVNPKASDESCIAALNAASALIIIERGGKGLDTKIGEGGIKLSGGERQRLAIARALLRQPELIIFDEATSSLDSLTEKSITETIQKISQSYPNLITVLIAHRLSTVAHADTIFVLERGAIIEKGSHSALIASGGLYAALWRQQGAEASSK